MKNQIATQQQPAADALFDPQAFAHMGEVARMMVNSEMLPAHLRGQLEKGRLVQVYTRDKQIATAFLVANAARRLGADPFALAQASFLVHGKLDFDGKTYAALANTRANLAQNLTFEYMGEGPLMCCVCSGRFRGEKEPRTVQTPVFDVCSKDKSGNIRDAWRGCDPEQQLSYVAARTWVRRYCPEVLLGLGSNEEQPDEPTEDDDCITVQSRGSINLLEKPPTLAIHLDAIERAETMDDLRRAREQFDLDDTLDTGNRQQVILAGRAKADQITSAEERHPHADLIAECEAVLHESDDPQEVSEAWKQIDAIADIPPAENKRLGELYNERMREFNTPVDQA